MVFKHLRKLLLSVFLFPLLSIAQSNYKPGYVVSLKGDTLHGFIDYKEWNNNPSAVSFRADKSSGTAQKFSPVNAVAFGITGMEYYELHKVSVSLGQVDVEKLSIGPDTSSTIDNVFLKRIVKGVNVNLYEYKDDIKTRFYIKERNSGMAGELIYRVYLNPGEVTQLVTQPRYKNRLNQLALKYLHNDGKLAGEIENAEYEGFALVSIVNKINGAENLDNSVTRVSPIRLFAGAGIDASSLKYIGETFLALNPSSKTSFGPRVGFGLDAFLNPNVGRFILRIEISATSRSLQTKSNTEPFASQSFKQVVTSISPQFIYNVYNTDGLKIFLDAGALINFNANSDNVYRYVHASSTGEIATLNNYPNLTGVNASFMGKAGVVLNKRFELYVTYIPAAVVTDHYGGFSGAVTSMQAGINYLFGGK